MQTKVIDQKSYKIHTIKTSKYKTTKILVSFRGEITKETFLNKIFFTGILSEGSKKYPNTRSLSIALEELYSPAFDIYSKKMGYVNSLSFSMNFINPEYITEKNYLENIISFLFDFILNPNVENNEFNIDAFNMVKRNILNDIADYKQDSDKSTTSDVLSSLFKNTPTGIDLINCENDINNLTPESLYKAYFDIINNDVVDIFVVGNTNLDNISNMIKKYYKNHHIRNKNFNYYINNISNKKSKVIEKHGDFLQSKLINIYNLIDLTDDEKEVVFIIFNYLFGDGNLTSKIYKYIREENSYCYSIDSSYLKYDNLFFVSAELDYKNIQHTIKLINKSLLEMQNGDFTLEELENAKQNLISILKINRDNPNFILQCYIFQNFLNGIDLDTKIKKISEVSRDDVINLAKKIKLNVTYIMQEEK